MTRRVFACLPALLFADPASEVWDVVASMAAALAEDNVPGFLRAVDPKMSGFADLATNVRALVEQADVQSVVQPLANEGGESARTLQLDWELRMKPKNDDVRMIEREQAVTLQFRRDNKKWRVLQIQPVAFFAPPDFQAPQLR